VDKERKEDGGEEGREEGGERRREMRICSWHAPHVYCYMRGIT